MHRNEKGEKNIIDNEFCVPDLPPLADEDIQ